MKKKLIRLRKVGTIMDKFEKVEKLREKTGVTYEEAKAALEATDYDLLDAIIKLEKEGKTASPKIDVFTTGSEEKTESEFEKAQKTYEKDCEKTTAGQVVDKMLAACGRLLKASINNNFIVERHNSIIIKVPVLLLIISLMAFAITIPLLIIGLFCECKYRFEGATDFNVNVDVNKMCDKASDACMNIKKDLTR